ncbi:MAG: sialidase [Verrucomicrobia bacterium]|nr:MAG: sialidase [Verrucomicrobiota bacterium]
MKRLSSPAVVLSQLGRAVGAGALALGLHAADPSSPVILDEFISETPGVPSVHASTIAETENGLVAAWFGGTEEGALDVSIWLTRQEGGVWTPPVEVANGYDAREHRRFPCWNPVLFTRANGDLLLFYRVGPSPSRWWSYVRLSKDGGRTWERIRRLPSGYLGPIKNPPIELPNGILLCGSSTEDAGWRVHLEWTEDPFRAWFKSKPLNDAFVLPAIQPAVLRYDENTFQILCRTKRGRIAEAWSTDGGNSWSELRRTKLPNPNSGLHAIRLQDGRVLMAYNHTERGRHLLNLATSPDGRQWNAVAVLENDPGHEYSYPTLLQTSDGRVHVVYTWRREKIKHVLLEPEKFVERPIIDGRWPE